MEFLKVMGFVLKLRLILGVDLELWIELGLGV
jgi:hypothetical protein